MISAYQHKQYHVRVRVMSENVDRVLGFIEGMAATALLGFLVYWLGMGAPITPLRLALAIGAMLTLLLLRGVPIDHISIGDRFQVDFEIRDRDR